MSSSLDLGTPGAMSANCPSVMSVVMVVLMNIRGRSTEMCEKLGIW